jgi:hypothetical protein
MSETRWTPGPWRAVLEDYGMAYSEAYVNIDDGWSKIASVWCSNKGYEANARLIAAAPELFGALNAARSQLKTLGTPDDPVNNHIIGMCDAALAKARGEQ